MSRRAVVVSEGVVKPVPYIRGGKRMSRSGADGWRLRPVDPHSGRQVERVFYGSYEGAVAELASLQKDLAARQGPTPARAGSVTVAEWSVTYLSRYRMKVPASGRNRGVERPWPTVAKVRDVLSSYVVPALGPKTRLVTLTYDDCLAAIAGLRLQNGKPAAPSTQATAASVMHGLLQGAVMAGLLSSNPAAGLPTSWGQGTRHRVVIPSIEEAEKLAQAMGKRPHKPLADIVRVITYTGLRFEELAGARIEDLDLEKRTLSVWQTVTESGGRRTVSDKTKTTAGRRSIVILDQAVEPLQRLVSYARSVQSEQIACGVKGGYISYGWWRKELAHARAESGVDYTAHALRHVCASVFIAAGATSEEVRNQMGHASVRITESVYRHAMELDKSELAARLSAAVTDLTADTTLVPSDI